MEVEMASEMASMSISSENQNSNKISSANKNALSNIKKKTKLNQEELNLKDEKVLIQNLNFNDQDEGKQWLIWHSQSCRLDAFVTISVFSILGDKLFSIQSLDSRSNRKLKSLLLGIQQCNNITAIQENVDFFALYRQIKDKEEIGKSHSIVPLFCLFETPNFIFNLQDQKICNCGFSYNRSFKMGPIISITISNLKDCQGNIQNAIIDKLNNYSTSCLGCKASCKVVRKVIQNPLFVIILLEFPEEFNSLKERKNFKEFHSIDLTLDVKINQQVYNLISICYFQQAHYTVHVNQIQHPKIKNLNSSDWHFHDGMLNGGKLIQNQPKLQFPTRTSDLMPYILLYKLRS